jgi:hypothetical protein
MNPVSTHSTIVERHARKNTRIASTAFHGILKRAIIVLMFLFAGAFIIGHTHPGPGHGGEGDLVPAIRRKRQPVI